MAKKEIPIETNRKGSLIVYNNIPEQDAVLITASKPIYLKTRIDNSTIANILGLKCNALDTALPIELIDAGLRTLIVPIENFTTAISLFPKEHDPRAFCLNNDIDIILLFSREVANTIHIAHTRVFVPRFGYLEDPATGSGNSAFGYYMLKNEMWNASDCIIEQGGNDCAFNSIRLSYKNDTVLFGGSATVRIDGVYLV